MFGVGSSTRPQRNAIVVVISLNAHEVSQTIGDDYHRGTLQCRVVKGLTKGVKEHAGIRNIRSLAWPCSMKDTLT